VAGDLERHIDRLIRQRPASREALESFKGLLGLTRGIEPKAHPIEMQEGLVSLKRKQGFPLFAREALPLDLGASGDLLAKFLEYLSALEREDKKGLEEAYQRSAARPGWAIELLRVVLKKDEEVLSKMAGEVDLESNTLYFLGLMSLRPALAALRQGLSYKMDKKDWPYGYCPLCGSQPDISFFDRSGKRHLHCELCGEEWPHPRLTCPFCQNQDHEALGYFEAESEEGLRVDFCRKCLRYLKVVDKRAFEETAPMELEALATLHLDVLALEQGFK